MAVSSVETRSTQSNGSLRGRPSSTAAVRWRIVASMLARLDGRHDRRHRLALRGVARRVHADEVGQFLALGLVGDLDAAQLRRRRIGAGVELDLHDVGVARCGHDPGADRAVILFITLIGAPLGFLRYPLTACSWRLKDLRALAYRRLRLETRQKRADYPVNTSSILVGTLIFGLAGLIPVIGSIFDLVFMLAALGVLARAAVEGMKKART